MLQAYKKPKLKLLIKITVLLSVLVFIACKPKENAKIAEQPKTEETASVKTEEPKEPERTLRMERHEKLAKEYANGPKSVRELPKIISSKKYQFSSDVNEEVPAALFKYPDIKIIKIEKDKKTIYCTQVLTAANGKKFNYDAKYEWNDFAGQYIRTEYILKDKFDIGNVDEELIKNQVHGDIIESKDDPKKDKLIPIFEEYMNKRDEVKDEYEAYYVLDYIKGNFTNSGKDEYLVFFTNGYQKRIYKQDYGYRDEKLTEEMWKISINETECFIVEDDKVITVYDLLGCGGYFIPNAFPNDESLKRIISTEGFGQNFFIGWVNDFNQNGINEIYVAIPNEGFFDYAYFIEFTGTKFNYAKHISFRLYDEKMPKVDWKTKSFIANDNINFDYPYGRSYAWFDCKMQWNEDDKSYCTISDIMTKKRGWKKDEVKLFE